MTGAAVSRLTELAPRRRWTFLVPVLTALVALLVLSWAGLREQHALEQAAAERVFSALGNDVKRSAAALRGQFQHAEYSIPRYADELRRAGEAVNAESLPHYLRLFHQRYQQDAQGVWRTPRQGFSADHDAGILIPPGVPLDDDMKAFFVIADDVTRLYGNGARLAPFVSSYAMPYANGIALFWPAEPEYVFSAGPEYNYLDTDWIRLTTQARNPEGKPVWTAPIFDPVTGKTLVSVVAPFWWRGQRFGSVGHDLPLDNLVADLLSLTISEGSRTVLVRHDGVVLVSPNYREKIVREHGRLSLIDVSDAALTTAWQRVLSTPEVRRVLVDGEVVFAEPVNDQGLWLLQAVPTAPVMAPISDSFQRLRVIVLAALLLEVMLASAMLLWMERRQRRQDQDLFSAHRALVNLNAELEQKVNQRTADLQTSVREMESFSFVVSHDLRAPLRHVSGYLTALREDLDAGNPSAARSHVEKCLASVERLNRIIQEMLALAQIGQKALSPEWLDLPALAGEVAAELTASWPAAAGIQRQTLPPVWADKALLRVVLQNLFDNACKYSAKTAVPLVTLSGGESEAGDAVWFEVRDNGCGFDEAYRDRLFQLFQRLHRPEEYAGTGVGLATCAKIINLHHGQIDAHATLGQGACFRVTLPKPGAPQVPRAPRGP